MIGATMADKFVQFFNDKLKEIQAEYEKDLKTQSEIEEFRKEYEKADFSELFLKMLNYNSNKMVNSAKMIMHENSLLFRSEEAEIIAKIDRTWSNAFVASEAMYLMIFDVTKNYSDFVSEIDDEEREKSIHKYTALKYIHGRGLQQFLEIITLMKNGFADGAYSRWRSLYELNIIASFISEYGEEVAEAYILSYSTEDRYEWARACGKFSPKKKYISFDDIRKKANFPSDLWQQQYQLANEVTHASSQGTFNRIGVIDGEEKISIGHTDYGLTIPGENSAITIARLTGLLLMVYPSGDSMVAADMINKWVDVVREQYFKTHDYIFPDEPKLWDDEIN